jgi:hypothetical protein
MKAIFFGQVFVAVYFFGGADTGPPSANLLARTL